VRYDAAIIGAGTNGLAAAAALAGAGLKTIVIERTGASGGRAATREFHPGFFASPFCDEMAPVPAEIFRALDLARHGAIFVPAPSSLALWPDRRHGVLNWAPDENWKRCFAEARRRAEEIRARAFADGSQRVREWWRRPSDPAPWPGTDWTALSLAYLLGDAFIGSADAKAHAMAVALCGRSADPGASGSALHLLAPGNGGSGVVMGGMATLASALLRAASAAGAEISLGLEAADIRLDGARATGVRLADGTAIEAGAVLSTLDLRRTFFSLFTWKDLPGEAVERVSRYRIAGGTARLLIALDAPPALDADFAQGPIHVAPDLDAFAGAHAAWRNASLAERLPMTLRLVSAADPRLAPQGRATMTATIGCIPHRLFDGAWTNEKRDALRRRILAGIEEVLPGTAARVLAAELILPPDIEDALGATAGDLDGGEIAPDQMSGWRGFAGCPGGRTPIAGLYLGGRSSPAGPLGTCAAGVAAARAIMADRRGGWFA
jgi:phytoene dehydrogenase-like protein